MWIWEKKLFKSCKIMVVKISFPLLKRLLRYTLIWQFCSCLVWISKGPCMFVFEFLHVVRQNHILRTLDLMIRHLWFKYWTSKQWCYIVINQIKNVQSNFTYINDSFFSNSYQAMKQKHIFTCPWIFLSCVWMKFKLSFTCISYFFIHYYGILLNLLVFRSPNLLI